ncbi:unnamed protein product, partial [Vitis vinifera]|uniref:Uncharacterized protein n=1 Tax=Vitis vinifera TaxID=29760 RepID=D7TQX5_VITVI
MSLCHKFASEVKFGYGASNALVASTRGHCFDHSTSLLSNSLIPSIKDPTIWKVKCMVGRERLSAFCLMNNYVDLQSLGTKLQIISVFLVDHVKGCIYIEADKQCDINEACKGLCTIYTSRVAPVPKNEVTKFIKYDKKIYTSLSINILIKLEFPCPQCGAEYAGFLCNPNTVHLQCHACGGMMPSRNDIGVPQHCLGCDRAFCGAYWHTQRFGGSDSHFVVLLVCSHHRLNDQACLCHLLLAGMKRVGKSL